MSTCVNNMAIPLILGIRGIMRCMKKGTIAQGEGLVYHAGFPNAGEDRQAIGLSLDELVIGRMASTFFWRLPEAVPELGWLADTLVVVDRSLPPQHGRLVVTVVDEAFMLCRMRRDQPVRLDGRSLAARQVTLWGVATYAVQSL